jgi:predicted nucleic acid-binding protein
MEGYLLDTNVIRHWLDERNAFHEAVAQKAKQTAQDRALMVTSAVVLGEIEYGIAANSGQGKQEMAKLRAHVIKQFAQKRLLLSVSRDTTRIYGELRAKLFSRFAPKERRKKVKRPEELVDPITSKELGIQENDLWIAAQAIERNLILVTQDATARIRQVASDLDGYSDLRVENWAAAAP